MCWPSTSSQSASHLKCVTEVPIVGQNNVQWDWGNSHHWTKSSNHQLIVLVTPLAASTLDSSSWCKRCMVAAVDVTQINSRSPSSSTMLIGLQDVATHLPTAFEKVSLGALVRRLLRKQFNVVFCCWDERYLYTLLKGIVDLVYFADHSFHVVNTCKSLWPFQWTIWQGFEVEVFFWIHFLQDSDDLSVLRLHPAVSWVGNPNYGGLAKIQNLLALKGIEVNAVLTHRFWRP